MIIPKVVIFGLEKIDISFKNCSIVKCEITDHNLNKILIEEKPNVIISTNNDWTQFNNLINMPQYLKRRWLHFKNVDEITDDKIMYCYMSSVINNTNKKFPLVTLFTSTYKSGYKIERPYRSLIKQTYKDWEWVIMDDSDDNNETYEMLKKVADRDHRIRLYKDSKQSGYIGKMKRDVGMLGYGEILVELDHDDDILDTCLEKIVKAFNSDPDIGFVYSDFTEIYENGENFDYGESWGFGYGAYMKVLYNNKWIHWAHSVPINNITLNHIVGVPNHIRAWRASVYRELGGHHYNLHVVDDYELILRTFLKYKFMRIPECLYIQYRNSGGNNFTFIRNGEIQKLTRWVSYFYREKISKRLEDLGFVNKTSRELDWEKDPLIDINTDRGVELILNEDPEKVSIVLIDNNNQEELINKIKVVINQTYKNWYLYIVGAKSDILDKVMESYKDNRIRWWNLNKKYENCEYIIKNYALKMCINTDYIIFINDRTIWKDNHLNKLMNEIKIDNENKFICEIKDKYDFTTINIDTLLFKKDLLKKYGYWQSDNSFLQKWLDNEKWIEKSS